MNAIVVKCPHCGARLQVVGAATEVKCEYCETVARVQRRTQLLQRVLPPPADGPRQIAVQPRAGKAMAIILVLFFAVPVLIIGLVIFFVTRTVNHAVTFNVNGNDIAKQVQSQLFKGGTIKMGGAPGVAEWQGTKPVLVDVDGDGKKEIVGRIRRVNPKDEVWLTALDGATGKPKWESEVIGSYTDTYQGMLAVVGDLLVFGNQRGDLRAFNARDGKPRWTAKIDERPKWFCDGGASTIVVLGKDDVERRFDRTTGTPAAAVPAEAVAEPAPTPKRRPGARPAKPPLCAALPNDTDDHARFYNPAQDWEITRNLAIDVRDAAPLVTGRGRLLIGQRKTGSRVGMIMLLDEANRELWSAIVPVDPLGSTEMVPQDWGVGDREACLSYYAESPAKPERIGCFSLADGKRRWDVEAVDRSIQSLVLYNRALLVSTSGSLEMRSLDDGKSVWQLGGR